mmetsp:Transcript_37009/g.68554  ORF Transcript_37009/g.68554 Transcript_37009/m.68554 type:complete len:223 (-) Transcript_37009:1820-2488(-)
MVASNLLRSWEVLDTSSDQFSQVVAKCAESQRSEVVMRLMFPSHSRLAFGLPGPWAHCENWAQPGGGPTIRSQIEVQGTKLDSCFEYLGSSERGQTKCGSLSAAEFFTTGKLSAARCFTTAVSLPFPSDIILCKLLTSGHQFTSSFAKQVRCGGVPSHCSTYACTVRRPRRAGQWTHIEPDGDNGQSLCDNHQRYQTLHGDHHHTSLSYGDDDNNTYAISDE